jgi:hypothetical protein
LFDIDVIALTIGGIEACDLLDSWPLPRGQLTCEVVDAVAAFTRTADIKTMTDEWQMAGDAEFDILAAGMDDASNFLLRLQQTYTYSGDTNEGAQANNTFREVFDMAESMKEETGRRSNSPSRSRAKTVCSGTPPVLRRTLREKICRSELMPDADANEIALLVIYADDDQAQKPTADSPRSQTLVNDRREQGIELPGYGLLGRSSGPLRVTAALDAA